MRLTALYSSTIALKASNAALRLGSTVLLARALGTTGFGTYVLILTIAGFASLPFTGGFSTFALRQIRSHLDRDAAFAWSSLRRLLKGLATLSLVSSAAYMFALVLYAERLSDLTVAVYYLSVLLVPLGLVIALGKGIVRGCGRSVQGLAPELFVRPLLFILSLGIYLSVVSGTGLTPGAAVVMQLWAATFSAVVAAYLAYRAFPAQGTYSLPSADPAFWRSFFQISAVTAIYGVNLHVDTLILGYFTPTDTVGYYRIASQGALLAALGVQSIKSALLPNLAATYARGDHEELTRLSTHAGLTSIVLAIIPSTILIIFGQELIELVFGRAYADAYIPMVILCSAHIICSAAGPIEQTYQMCHQEHVVFRVIVAAASLNILLNIVLIPILGAIGCAVATACALVFWSYTLLALSARCLPITPFPLSFGMSFTSPSRG